MNEILQNSKKIGIIILPASILLLALVAAFLVGGMVLVGQSLKNWILGFITGIPLLFIFGKRIRQKAISIFQRK